MLLAIDVGNTQTVLGVYDGEKLLRMWRVGTDDAKTSDEMSVVLRGLLELAQISVTAIDGAVLGTVVPAQKRLWDGVCRSLLGVEMLVMDAAAASGLIDVQARGAGADRIANAVAAKQLYGAPVIAVDFGTATDMEVVDSRGSFLGGIIAPGVEMSMRSLVRGTALLPAIDLADPGVAIGGNTVEAIQVGVVSGEADRVDGLVRRIWRQLGYETFVVATGGLAESIGKMCQTVDAINSELTLQGLRLVHESRLLSDGL